MADVRTSGPLFDGRADAIIAEMVKAIRKDVANEGQRLARAALDGSIRRHVNGKAVPSVTITETSRTYTSGSAHKSYTMAVIVPAETTVVTTSLATYGPWLEGTGSRNSPVTRFPGYHSFRAAAGLLNGGQAKIIAEKAAEPYIRRLSE